MKGVKVPLSIRLLCRWMKKWSGKRLLIYLSLILPSTSARKSFNLFVLSTRPIRETNQGIIQKRADSMLCELCIACGCLTILSIFIGYYTQIGRSHILDLFSARKLGWVEILFCWFPVIASGIYKLTCVHTSICQYVPTLLRDIRICS